MIGLWLFVRTGTRHASGRRAGRLYRTGSCADDTIRCLPKRTGWLVLSCHDSPRKTSITPRSTMSARHACSTRNVARRLSRVKGGAFFSWMVLSHSSGTTLIEVRVSTDTPAAISLDSCLIGVRQRTDQKPNKVQSGGEGSGNRAARVRSFLRADGVRSQSALSEDNGYPQRRVSRSFRRLSA